VRQLYEMEDFKDIVQPATADRFKAIGVK
jgi:hypothetical protein